MRCIAVTWLGKGLQALGVVALGALGAAGCAESAGEGEGEGESVEPANAAYYTSTPEDRMRTTVEFLAGLGPKRPGTPKGQQAGDYLKWRFETTGLSGVHYESFAFNSYDVASSAFTLTATSPDGSTQPLPIAGYEVFAYSGEGAVTNAEVVDMGEGRPENYASRVDGKIVLVKAVQAFHRISQLRIAREQGAVGMISVSFSPSNLVQIGAVATPELGFGPAPAVSVGGVDGEAIRNALAAGKTVRANLQVDATISVRQGRNVVGRLKRPNSSPSDPYILVGAHYDTWTAGAIDNCTSVAAMLEIARTLKNSPAARNYDVVFVGYDAEEVGVLGGYDYLRQHVVHNRETVMAFVHLEMLGRAKPELQGLTLPRYFVHSQNSPLARLAEEADVDSLFPFVFGLENVVSLTGGIIPTDVQGMYWYGVDGTIAFGASPFYHTAADTADTVDMPFVASNTERLLTFLNDLDQEPAATFSPKDPTLLYPEIHLDRSNPAITRVDVTVRDANGQPVPSPWARVQLYVNDFITPQKAGVPENNAGVQEVIGDQNGKVTFDIASSLVKSDYRSRWIQVRVGNASDRYPRGEGIVEIY